VDEPVDGLSEDALKTLETAPPADPDSDGEDGQPQTEVEKKIDEGIAKWLAEFSLSPIATIAAKNAIRKMALPQNRDNMARVRQYIVHRLSGRKRAPPPTPWHNPCPEIFPGLRPHPFWDVSSPEMAWTKEFESHYDVIREELMALRGQAGFQPYRGPSWTQGIEAPDGLGKMSHDAGDWNVFYLFLHDAKFEENCKRCPETVRLIEKVAPRHYSHAFFSALTPGTHITHHNGPTNKKLRCHLPLTGCKGAKLRVGDEFTNPEEKKLFVMDDSFEHEAWHDGNETRIVLIFDIWHPDLTDKEIRFIGGLQRSKLRAELYRSEHDKSNENFYSLIENTKDVLKDDDSWWIDANDAGQCPDPTGI